MSRSGCVRVGLATAGAISIATAALALLCASTATAQDVQVQSSRGPHYVGDPITIQVVASGFEEEPTPNVETPKLEAGSLRFAGVSPSVSNSISIVNGKMTRSKEVRFVYQYELLATRAGRVTVPAFSVSQGGTSRETRPFAFDVKRVPTTGMVELSLDLPKGPIFVGQKVPVGIELRIDREAERDLVSLTTSVPLFDVPSLRFVDTPRDADNALEIRTANGTLQLPADAREERVGGRVVLVLRAERTMIAQSPDPVRADPARAVITRGTRFRRDLFGQRQAASVERLMSEGEQVSLEVVEVPRDGRPPSFAGAVGQGFTLEVSADRSVVQLGEPIVLHFTLRGDGDLSTAGLPPFDSAGFFDADQFRLPEDPPAGLVDERGKHFEASLRVLDANVREVPALEYSWFDAKSRRFETTRTRPIALSVGAAQIIGADDVDRSAGAAAAARNDREVPEREEPSAPSRATERRDSLAASGANLAIDTEPARVLGRGAPTAGADAVLPTLYGVSFALLGFAAFDARRRARDPGDVARAAAIADARRGLRSAREGGGAEALGRTLRELIAAVPEAASAEVDAILGECDALRFAPGGDRAALPEALAERAVRLIEFVEKDGEGGA